MATARSTSRRARPKSRAVKPPSPRSAARPPTRAKPKSKAKPKPRGRARIGRPPGKSSAETRAAIVASALDEFTRVGFERATNRAIAKRAGVTGAALYQYFDSKVALYVAVLSDTMETLLPPLRTAAEAAPSARAALAAMVRAQLGVKERVAPARFLAAVPVELQRHPELAQAMIAAPGGFFELVLQVVKRGVRGGEIARERAEQTIGAYIALQIGLAIHGGTVPASHAAAGIEGVIALLEGTLFHGP